MSLRRTTALRSDPEKTRAWQDRSRSNLSASRGFEGRSGPIPRGKPKRRARIPSAVRARVFARSKGRCICGCGKKATHIHHGLEVSRWPHLELIEANMVGLNHDCNWAHHNAQPRIEARRLPQCVFDLAREMGPKAEAEIDRYYG